MTLSPIFDVCEDALIEKAFCAICSSVFQADKIHKLLYSSYFVFTIKTCGVNALQEENPIEKAEKLLWSFIFNFIEYEN